MSINNLPEDVVKHEIMEYLKPVYKVVEVTYLEISTILYFDFEIDEPRLKTKHNVRTGLFKISQKTATGVYDFNPYNCYMSQTTLARIEKIREEDMGYEQNKVFHTDRDDDAHATFIYISHTIVCS